MELGQETKKAKAVQLKLWPLSASIFLAFCLGSSDPIQWTSAGLSSLENSPALIPCFYQTLAGILPCLPTDALLSPGL